MAIQISNPPGGKRSIIHATANASVVVVGDANTSNVAATGQVIVDATITRVLHGAAPSGYWNIKRGSNLVATFDGTGSELFDAAPISMDKTGSLVFELVGTANGYIMVEIHKSGVL